MKNITWELIQSPQVIAFLGPAGTGKSTQIRLLMSKLGNQGLKVRSASLKTTELFAQILIHFLTRLLSINTSNVFPIRGLIEDKPTIFKSVFEFWLFLDFVSINILYLWKVYIPNVLGYTVIVEEYLTASIADYIYLSKVLGVRSKFLHSTLIPHILRLYYTRSSTIMFFLDTIQDELQIRWKQRGSLKEKSDYIHMQRTFLLSLSKKLSLTEVIYLNTTNQSIKKTHSVIVKNLTAPKNKFGCGTKKPTNKLID